MISDVLIVLKDMVNDHLSSSSGWSAADSDHGQVVFHESEKVDVIDFKMGAISLLLINLGEERSLRPADPYRRTLADGTTQQVKPPIHLNAHVLFVARFKDYSQSLKHISLILQLFLGRPVLDHETAPALSDRIEKLTMELVSLPFAELNNLWGILRTAYQPSLLYKVRMMVFEDEDGVAVPPVREPVVEVHS